MNTQIKKIGNSKGIIIPAAIIKTLNLNETDEINIKIIGDKMILTKVSFFNPQSLTELFEGYRDTYEGEIVFDEVKGREVW